MAERRERPNGSGGFRVSPAREAAFSVLERVATSAAHSDDLLHGPGMAGMSQADKDLATALVLGVLRWQIALDARVRPFLSRPDAELSLPVAIALRLGAFQLLHMDRIPAHAALNESVELVRVAGHAHAAGMVNAVLRKLAGVSAQRKPLVESTAAMAERLGHPSWLVERWIAAYGRTAAEGICGFDQRQPGYRELFALGDPEAPATDAGSRPVMDAGSRLVAELAAACGAGARRVWDCCAAPGGKTVVLAQRLPEAEILATDLSPVRLKRLAQRLDRDLPGRAVRVREADAATLPESEGVFELVLCDVPCSGTGTLARNPEIRHRLRASDLQRQAVRQGQILRGALRRVAPGGRLVYSTCSLESEENEVVVREALGAVPEVKQVPVAGFLRGMASSEVLAMAPEQTERLTRADALRTLPGAGFEGDGFFAVVLERA